MPEDNFGFHSISFPSEWGRAALELIDNVEISEVSIQLVSPASGDAKDLHQVYL